MVAVLTGSVVFYHAKTHLRNEHLHFRRPCLQTFSFFFSQKALLRIVHHESAIFHCGACGV